jgi:iron(III) transport system ATP-binding protein
MAPWNRNVGMVFQSYALWPHMSVRKNIAFGLEERKVPADEIKRRIDAVLDLVDLSDFADRRPSQLSGGQQQRVALARTIVVEPRVLLLDEPLSNLDASLRNQMRRDILELQRKLSLTTIFVTHDQEEANTISDRIAVLNEGKIQQVGRPIDLYDKPTNRFVASFLGAANLLEGRVNKVNGDAVFESNGNLDIPLLDDKNQVDESRIVMFRPQDIAIAFAGDNISNSDSELFEGVVSHREFLGNRVRYSVDVKKHVIIVDDSYSAGRRIFEFGQKVVLNLNLKQIRMLAE